MNVSIEYGPIRRGRRDVLRHGRLELPARAAVAVIGANGAGKSTLFLALTDILVRRSGTLAVTVPWEDPRVAFMPQETALPGWLTGAAIAQLYGFRLDALGSSMPELRLDEMTALRGTEMSGGQRQALALGLALGARAHLTILDEPLTHLDLPRRHAALRAIAGHSSGLTLMSTQSAADVVDVCDWYIVLHDGGIVFNGPVTGLLDDAWHGDPARQARLEHRLLELMGFGKAGLTPG
jgi:ABC-type multidrug transport system ATPase subunit